MKIFKFVTVGIVLLLTSVVSYAEISEKDFGAALEKYVGTVEGRKVIGGTIEAYVKDRQQEEKLKQEAMLFKDKVDIEIGGSPTKGPKDATIKIIEFSDFECPYCSQGQKNVEEVLKQFPGKVSLTFKNLPLEFHKNALPAAKAALAADKQGKFWDFHDELFANQRTLNDEFYEKTAKKLNLDVDKFKKDMESEEVKKQIESDSADAKKAGAAGTPMFVVNGVKLRGAQPPTEFARIIEKLLADKK
jgi:protein-disulfide isomerase